MSGIEYTPERLERERLENLDMHRELIGSSAPGSKHCHEAFRMAIFLQAAVYRELCVHPSINANREWFALAMRASLVLVELYEKIGKEHVDADDPDTKI